MKLVLLLFAAILAAAAPNPTINIQPAESYAKSAELYQSALELQQRGLYSDQSQAHVHEDVAYQGQGSREKDAKILSYKMGNDGHNYEYQYETDNGIKAQEIGQAIHGTQVQGGYSYTGDDGHVYTVTYTADENGFRASGDHLPTPPPIPDAIAKALEENAQAEANGVFDDGKYKPEAEEGYQHYEENQQQNTEHHTSQPIQQTEHHASLQILNTEHHVPVQQTHHQISLPVQHQISLPAQHQISFPAQHQISIPSHHQTSLQNHHQISIPSHHAEHQISLPVQQTEHHVPQQHNYHHHLAQPTQNNNYAHIAQPHQNNEHYASQSIQNIPHPVPQIQRTEYYTHHPIPHNIHHQGQQNVEQHEPLQSQRVTYHIAQPFQKNFQRGQPIQLAQRRNQFQGVRNLKGI